MSHQIYHKVDTQHIHLIRKTQQREKAGRRINEIPYVKSTSYNLNTRSRKQALMAFFSSTNQAQSQTAVINNQMPWHLSPHT